ncbi:hypothetical protein [Microcystis phage Mel-JY01]
MSDCIHKSNIKVVVDVKKNDIIFGDDGELGFYPWGTMKFTPEAIKEMRKVLLNKLIPNWAKHCGVFKNDIDSYLEKKFGNTPTGKVFDATITISDKIIINEMSLETEPDEDYDFPLTLLPANIKYKITIDGETINRDYLDDNGYSMHIMCLVLSDNSDSDYTLKFIYTENDYMPYEYGYPVTGELGKIKATRDEESDED